MDIKNKIKVYKDFYKKLNIDIDKTKKNDFSKKKSYFIKKFSLYRDDVSYHFSTNSSC